jgi:hypothetical protein
MNSSSLANEYHCWTEVFNAKPRKNTHLDTSNMPEATKAKRKIDIVPQTASPYGVFPIPVRRVHTESLKIRRGLRPHTNALQEYTVSEHEWVVDATVTGQMAIF